jgi:hypothetical protein
MKKHFLVSGLAASDNGGVGILMKHLIPAAISNGYSIITRRDNQSIERYLKEKAYFKVVQEYIARWLDGWLFQYRTAAIKGSVVLMIHPQSIGYPKAFRIIQNNRVFLYVMDTSFFCIQAYNYDPIEKKECFRCLQNFDNILETCLSDHSGEGAAAMISNLKSLQQAGQQLHFLLQNKAQQALVKQFFGGSIQSDVVGLDTGELPAITEKDERGTGFDIVYHGSLYLAKGIEYTVNLALALPELQFFIPVAAEKVIAKLPQAGTAKNITFSACSWQTGLMLEIQRARFVINPSLWSAPIEGALIKSIAYNGNVISVATEYGYEKEVGESYPLIRVPFNEIEQAAAIIRQAASTNFSVPKQKVAEQLIKFREQQQVANVFKAVDQ